MRLAWLAAAIAAVLPGVARAQSAVAQQQVANIQRDVSSPDAGAFRSHDDLERIEARRDRQEAHDFFEGAGHVRAGEQYGGWTSFTYLDLRDLNHNGAVPEPIKSVTLADTRAWYEYSWSARRAFYVRVRKQDLDINTAPGAVALDTRTKDQLDVDLLTYDFPVFSTDWRIGRQFLRMGRGLVLSDILDGARIEYRSHNGVKTSGFVGSTLHRSDNIDTNVVGFDQGHNNRTFVGVTGEYTTTTNDRPYAYFMKENDNSDTANPIQDPFSFQYDAFYWGVGSDGPIGDDTLYSLELVFEGGKAGTSNGGTGREKIDAGAAWLSVFHRLVGTSLPTLTFDYAWGSGDNGRFSVTDSGPRGPRSGLGDENFIGFGRFEGGLALQPRLSNLHVIRAGFQCKPLEGKLKAPSDLLAGFKITDYEKSNPKGVISDPLATVAKSHVGIGTDVFVAYKPMSDLDLLFEYGGFSPGGAFPIGAKEESHKLAVTATISY